MRMLLNLSLLLFIRCCCYCCCCYPASSSRSLKTFSHRRRRAASLSRPSLQKNFGSYKHSCRETFYTHNLWPDMFVTSICTLQTFIYWSLNKKGWRYHYFMFENLRLVHFGASLSQRPITKQFQDLKARGVKSWLNDTKKSLKGERWRYNGGPLASLDKIQRIERQRKMEAIALLHTVNTCHYCPGEFRGG